MPKKDTDPVSKIPKDQTESTPRISRSVTRNQIKMTTNNVVMTDDQFRELLNMVKQQNNDGTISPQNIQMNTGNFAKCTSRFNGEKSVSVEAFIDAIKIYKDCTHISEVNALMGLPMLLEGTAAKWWYGVKGTVTSFDDALELLLSVFGQKKAPYKIYREIFSNVQAETMKTDFFICNVRALFSQLPPESLTETVQLDMVYGLLSKRIRSKIKRESFTKFDELIKLARIEEEFYEDENQIKEKVQNVGLETFCKYCKKKGHVIEECRKKPKDSKSFNKNKTEKLGNSAQEPTKSTYSCYGCGTPGYVRSTCPKCSSSSFSSNKSPPATFSASTVDFHNPLAAEFDSVSLSCSISEYNILGSTLSPKPRPVLNISILGSNGCGIIDTAAKLSIASLSLYKILLDKGATFESQDLNIVLADGIQKQQQILFTTTDVVLEGRMIPTTFIVLPGAENTKTLLGIDFIKNSRIIIDFAKNQWKFHDSETEFSLKYENTNQKLSTDISSLNVLRADEGCSLTDLQRGEINKFLEQNENVFSLGGVPTTCAEHCIDTSDHIPVFGPAYKMSLEKRNIIRQELDKMIKDDIIEECESPWASPVVLVKKPNDSYRFCVDYRRLNAITASDKYPMPRIDELLHLAKKTLFMSTIDLRCGYWQVPVRFADRDKTAFICSFGLYRFKRMSFGLKNAPATFQRMVDRLKSGIPEVTILAYLDDIVILSESVQQHLSDLEKVFNRLRQFKLRANREKCFFYRESIRFLGHVINGEGISTDPDKVSVISERDVPRNVKEVKSFLQTCSWYRKFVPGFSEVSRPLSDLTKKKSVWAWNDAHQRAFDSLKRLLINAPILQQADETKPYTLRTDASNYAVGAVLLQGEDVNERPIEYASRLLLPAEKNYSTTEREALAVVWALNKFRGYIDGAEVTIGTDHQPLKWLMTLKSPSGRLARWVLLIQGFNLKFIYTPGKANLVADTLSRPPYDENKQDCEISSFQMDFPTYAIKDIRKLQLEDDELEKIIICFEQLDHPDLGNWTGRGYLMESGVLFRYAPDQETEDAQLVIPAVLREHVLKIYHDSPTAGHYGVERTINKIRSKYHWKGMRKYIAEYVRYCNECQKFKPSNLKPSGLIKTPVMQQRFEVLAIDLFGPLPITAEGYKWILIIEDTASRWVELFPLCVATAEACAKVLISDIFMRYGLPRRMISDNGSQFISDVMQHVSQCFHITQNLIPVYHPEANPVERKNRDLKVQLAILTQTDHTRWAENISSIRFALNTTKTDSTGQTPAFVTFGRELRVLEDVAMDIRPIIESENFIPQITPYLWRLQNKIKEVRDHNENQQDKRKAGADKSRRLGRQHKVGDLVLVQSHLLSNASKKFSKKFAPRRDGPYRVSKVISSTTFELETADRNKSVIGRYHTSALTPYAGQENSSEPIVRKKGRRRRSELPSRRFSSPEGEHVARQKSE